jgi:ATP-dependent DNA helicase RecQ
MQAARQILKSVFGYEDFISTQAQVIHNVLAGRDTLAVMPTGGGKSLCYQVPALIFQGLTVVVSPLISLMQDQIQQLQQNGVAAALLNSMLSADEYRRNKDLIRNGQAKLLYVAPETLLKPGLMDLLASARVACLAVDEVHCVSEWGHDFRPEYRRLSEVRRRLAQAVCLALTATATHQVRQDIKACLELDQAAECIAGFDRPNLFLKVALKDQAYAQCLAAIHGQTGQPGIVYCATRRQVDRLSAALVADGISALPYHAGLPDTQRQLHQQRFSRDDIQVMVATVAFGMGIDKSNVRFVIHFDLPKNIESYYQEIGRAGRDGARSDCLLLYSYGDIHKVKYMISQMATSRQRVANLMLTAMLRYVESDVCRRKVLLEYFGDSYEASNCGMCDICLAEEKPTEDLTVAAQKLLSCVKRTSESFGVAHVIDVLRGSQSSKVMRLGHEKLSTYGIGREYSHRQWRQLARQLLHQGLMTQDMAHGALRLTPQAWELFRGQRVFQGTLETETGVAKERNQISQKAQSTEQDFDAALFEILRRKRKALADEARVPPFVIFSDKTLMEMAAWFPQSLEGFLQIHGIGQAKAQKYGDAFVTLIRQYCAENGIAEGRRPGLATAQAQPLSDRSQPQTKRRHVEIGEAYNHGESIHQLMERYNVKRQTIVNHLYTYWRDDHPLRYDRLLDETSLDAEAQKRVLAVFESLGCDALSPVYQALHQSVGYDDLHILRLYHLNCRRSG